MSWMAQLLERGRQRHGDRTAIVDGHRRVNYADLDRRTDGLAATFLARGVERGNRVAVVSHNRLEVLETYFALGKIGACAVPVHYGSTRDETAAILASCDVSAVVGESDLVHGFDGLAYESDSYEQPNEPQPRDIPDDDLMFILHTSATTGRPKGVCVDHHSLRSLATGYTAEAGPMEDVVYLHCGPLSHGAMVIPLTYMASGATIVLMRMFSPPECLATIRRTNTTHLFVVPEMLRFMLRTRGIPELPSLREIVYAAAPMPRPLLIEAHERFGCGFRQVYGITEGGGPVATLSPADHDYASSGAAAPVGRALMGTEIAAFDGELWVRGPTVMRRYWADSVATAETMRDGWVRTGDLGTVDENGYIHLAGRAKDVIVRGGQKVFPAELERVLVSHPEVSDACVVGVPSEEWGELPFAYVVAADPATGFVDSLRRLVRDNLAAYKRPVGFEVLPELPRNKTGKVVRRELRERAIGDAGVLT